MNQNLLVQKIIEDMTDNPNQWYSDHSNYVFENRKGISIWITNGALGWPHFSLHIYKPNTIKLCYSNRRKLAKAIKTTMAINGIAMLAKKL